MFTLNKKILLILEILLILYYSEKSDPPQLALLGLASDGTPIQRSVIHLW